MSRPSSTKRCNAATSIASWRSGRTTRRSPAFIPAGRAWSAHGHPRFLRCDVRERHDRCAAGKSAPPRRPFDCRAQRARARSRAHARRRARGLGRRHQRLCEIGAGLAPRRPPRQPGNHGRSRRTWWRPPRPCIRRWKTFGRRAGCRAATRRRSGRPCSVAASWARRRAFDASAGRRQTAISSTSTGRAKMPMPPCSCSFTASKARRPATTHRPSPSRRGSAAGASRCRTFAAARASSIWRRAPITPATGKRWPGSWPAFARCIVAPSSRSVSRSAATPCCASPKRRGRGGRDERSRHRRRLGAARSGRRRPLDRPRLRAPGLHPHVHALDEAEGAEQARPASRPLRRRTRCARPSTCAISTTSSPHRCTASRRRRLLRARLGRAAARPDPDPGARAQCAQRSVPAGGRVAACGRGRARA